MSAPTSEELQLIEIFRKRVNDLQFAEGQSTNQHLLRWIRAREGELDKAEEMLRKHIEWRKINGIGPSLLHWHPPPFLTATYPARLIGFDKEGSPIIFLEFGAWDIRKAVAAGHKDAIVKYKDKVLEQVMCLMKLYENWRRSSCAHSSANVTQFIALADWEGFSLRYIMNKEVVEVILEAARSFEANYPETLKSGFNVNCPKVFAVLFNLIKPFLSERTLSKIKIFDSNEAKWKPELWKVVPEQLLPHKYGGSRQGKMEEMHSFLFKEGDEELEGVMKRSKAITDKQEDKKELEKVDEKELTNVRVAPGYKVHVPLKSTRVGDRIRWYFRVEEKDICFSVVVIKPNQVLQREEVVTPEKITGDHCGSHICEMVGDYALCFDNSYSTFKAKMVQYKVTMDNPFQISND